MPTFHDFIEAAKNLINHKIPARTAELNYDVTGPCLGLTAKPQGPFTSLQLI